MYDTYTFPGNSFSFAMGSSTSIGVLNRLQNLYKLKDMGYDITNIMLQFGVNDITQSNGNDHEINFKKILMKLSQHLKEIFQIHILWSVILLLMTFHMMENLIKHIEIKFTRQLMIQTVF